MTYAERPWLAAYGGLPADMEAAAPELASALELAAEAAPGAVAVRHPDQGDLTYSELAESAAGLSSALAERGLERGGRLAVMLQNVPEYLVAQWAAWRLGAALVPRRSRPSWRWARRSPNRS